jgi:hypothetical protein
VAGVTSSPGETPTPPLRQVRAVFDDETLTVYQSYSPHIADAALAAGTFVSPFKIDRMTWIKPSFLWMMYRSGWASKPGQERILAIRISRAGFEEALAEACLSHFEAAVHHTYDEWLERKKASPVRVQWDPERSPALEPLSWRSIQVGLGTPAVRRYVSEWVTQISDVTDTARALGKLIEDGEQQAVLHQLPAEKPYPLPEAVARNVGAS